MKRIFLVMLVAMIAAVSCQKSELTTQNGSGDEVTVNISAVMQSDNATTRAITEKGKASQINRCIMEIYTSDNELYQRQVTSVDNTSLKASFSINLVPDKTYDFVFWADCATVAGDTFTDIHYTTNGDNGLKAITANYTDYEGNDEKRDAFFATVNQEITANASNVEAKLYRPFGQVNVSTYVTDLITSYLPTEVQVTYTSENIATTFNAFDGTTSGSDDFAWEAAATVIETPEVGEILYHLSTDYIFAPKEAQALIDFKMEFFNGGASIMTNDKFTSIPVQRNYRTNISGNLLTIGSDITVEVVPTFTESDIEVEITTVETVAEVSNALAVVTTGDDANVTVTGTVSGDSDNHIVVPDAVASTTGETSITVTFEDVDENATISFGGDTKNDDSEYDGTVYINAPADVEFTDLTINLPNAHIVFNGEAKTVTEATSGTTFVVAEGAKIGTLTVNAGNVDVYGTVTSIAQGTDNTSITEVTIYTQGKGLDYASTMVGNLTDLQANTDEFKVVIINNDIQNVTTGEYYETIRAAVNAAEAGDVIEITEGEYPIDILDVEWSTDPNNDGSISVVVENLTLRGVGDVTLYGNHTGEFEIRPTTRSVKRQRMIHVEAQNFVMENLTLMPAKYIAYNGDIKLDAQSHTIVGLSIYNYAPDVASGFIMKNCKITPNTISTGDCAADPNYAGMLFLGKTNNVTIDNVIFDRAKLQLDDEVETEAENSKNVVIKNCSFNGTLPANVWDDSIIPNVKLSTPLANITIENTVFSDLGNGASSIICDEGTLNLNNCTFPDENCYYTPQDDGRIFINGVEYIIPYAMIEGNETEYSTIQAALDVAAEGATITLNGATFDENITFKQNNITLKGANAGISGISENRNPESILLGDINLSADNIVIDGIRMTGASTRVAKLQGSDIDGLTFKNSVVDNISKNFIYYGDSPNVYNRNILIENNKIMDSNSNSSSCSNIYICNPIDLTISGNYIANSSWAGMIISGSGYGENVCIENNTFADHNVRYDLMLSGLFKTAVTISGNTFNHSSSYCALYLYLQQDTPTSAVHNINDNTFNSNTCISMGAWDSNGYSYKATYDADNFKMNGNTFNISTSSSVVLITEDRFGNYNGYIQFLNNKIYEDGNDNFSWDSAFDTGGPFSITESSQLQVDTYTFLPEW